MFVLRNFCEQSAGAPFGCQSPFGPTINVTNRTFAPKPFGSQTGGSMFGNTSTGVFGQSSSSLSSTPAFGSVSPYGSGSSTLASGSSQSPFGGTGFGASGSGGAFGSTNATSAFEGITTPFIGATTAPAFAASTNPGFGSSPAFSGESTPSFVAESTPSSVTLSFTFWSYPSSYACGVTPSPFGAQSSSFGSQATTPTFRGVCFGQSTSSDHFGGSRVTSYITSTDADGCSSTKPAGMLLSLCAMPIYKDKNHEELRWEDYQQGDKGGPNHAVQSNVGINFGVSVTQSNPVRSSLFGQSSGPTFCNQLRFGSQATTPTCGGAGFGKSSSSGQRRGTRVTSYVTSPYADGCSSTQTDGKLLSVCAMPIYKDKSHEELRWEDYQHGDKGGPNPGVQSNAGMNFVVSATQFQSNSNYINMKSSMKKKNFIRSNANIVRFSDQVEILSLADSCRWTENLKDHSKGKKKVGRLRPAKHFSKEEDEMVKNSSTFGGLGSNTQSSPFGNSFQQSQLAFGSSPAFGASSQPSLGGSSPFVFGSSSTPSFGATTSPFFGTIGIGFGACGSGGAFGSTSTSISENPYAVGGTTTPTFGAYANPTFGGAGFGQSTSSGQRGGSRAAPYLTTPDAYSTQPAEMLQSLCAMPIYNDKSHEELRWEDYQHRDKGGGGPNPGVQSNVGMNFGVSATQFQSTSNYYNMLCPLCCSNNKDMAFGCGHLTCCDYGKYLRKYPICQSTIQTRTQLYY